jgi:hypothetical protein
VDLKVVECGRNVTEEVTNFVVNVFSFAGWSDKFVRVIYLITDSKHRVVEKTEGGKLGL